MGVEIVKAATIYGRRLSGNAFKVLVTMSLSALDKPSNGRPAGLYWGGWDGLAVTLGHPDATRNSSGHKAVKRAVRELREAQHITPMLDAHRGVAQSYLVHPGGITKGDHSDPVKGGQNGPVKGGQNGPQSGVKMTPPRKEQGFKGLTQDINLNQLPISPTAREDAAAEIDPHMFEGRTGDDCDRCGLSYINRTAHPIRLLRRRGA